MKLLFIAVLFVLTNSVFAQTVVDTGNHPDSHVNLSYSVSATSPFISLDVYGGTAEVPIVWAEISYYIVDKNGIVVGDQREYTSTNPTSLENLYASGSYASNSIASIELYYYVFYEDGTYEEVRITEDF